MRGYLFDFAIMAAIAIASPFIEDGILLLIGQVISYLF